MKLGKVLQNEGKCLSCCMRNFFKFKMSLKKDYIESLRDAKPFEDTNEIYYINEVMSEMSGVLIFLNILFEQN